MLTTTSYSYKKSVKICKKYAKICINTITVCDQIKNVTEILPEYDRVNRPLEVIVYL